MNAQQRKEIAHIIDQLAEIRDGQEITTLCNHPPLNVEGVEDYRKTCTDVSNAIDDLRTQVEDQRDIEQEKFDNMPESLQASERGDAMQEGIDNLEDAVQALESASSLIDDDDDFGPDMVDDLCGLLEDAIGALGNI